MSRNRIIGSCGALLTAMLALPATGRAQEYTEAQVYGIANFGAAAAGLCCSGCGSHSVHTDTAAAFQSTFQLLQAVGLWNESQARNNSQARGSYFTDSSKAGSCVCSAADTTTDYGADDADVMYVHTHGGHVASSMSGYYSTLEMGNASYDCDVRTDQNMLWGNPSGAGDLGIAVVKACQSGDYDVWSNHGYRAQYSTTDSSFRVWNAFHGDSSCGSHVTSYVGVYGILSLYEGLGENWIDLAYDDDAYTADGAVWDDCPVSIISGATSSQREAMYEHGGWLDRKATGDKTNSTYYGITECSPDHGRVLPTLSH